MRTNATQSHVNVRYMANLHNTPTRNPPNRLNNPFGTFFFFRKHFSERITFFLAFIESGGINVWRIHVCMRAR